MRVEWTGSVIGGKLTIKDREQFLNAVAVEFGSQETLVDITIERMGRKRTSAQNRYLWGVCYKLLADHTGHTAEDMHDYCKRKFHSKIFEIGTEVTDIGSSTADMTTEDFMEYCENIRQLGASLGINIPLPGEDL